MIGPLTTGIMQYINKKREQSPSRESISLHFCLLHICSLYEKYFDPASISLEISSWFPLFQLQQAISNRSKTRPEGTEKENESGEYTQWPLQTPSMINVKGFLFLICQSFQRSLTYAYFQPQRSHHSSRWSGTSKPITTRLCWGWCCQSCKLAHLQPFIMHCSKEQHVFLRAGQHWAM